MCSLRNFGILELLHLIYRNTRFLIIVKTNSSKKILLSLISLLPFLPAKFFLNFKEIISASYRNVAERINKILEGRNDFSDILTTRHASLKSTSFPINEVRGVF